MGVAKSLPYLMLLLLICLCPARSQNASANDDKEPQPCMAVLLTEARNNFDFITPPVRPADAAWKSELLVEALIQVESAGEPRRTGAHGERGLMQLKEGTWNQMSRQVFGAQLPFDMAFDPDLNRLLGRAYLAYLSEYLAAFKEQWGADERTLLLACYNYGPDRVRTAGFSPARLPRVVLDYADRISALHNDFLLRSTAPAEMAASAPAQSVLLAAIYGN